MHLISLEPRSLSLLPYRTEVECVRREIAELYREGPAEAVTESLERELLQVLERDRPQAAQRLRNLAAAEPGRRRERVLRWTAIQVVVENRGLAPRP